MREATPDAHARDLNTLWGMLAGCAGWHPDPQATWAKFRRIATEQGVPMASEDVEAEARERIAKRPPNWSVTDEAVEAGARALAENQDSDWWTDALDEWKADHGHVSTCHRFIARAVLEAVAARHEGGGDGPLVKEPLNLDAEEIDGIVREMFGDEACDALEVRELGCMLKGFALALQYVRSAPGVTCLEPGDE